MAEKNRTQYQGLALPDTRASVWAAESSYTQAGPTPGIPVADNSTNMVLQSSGTQSASKSLDIRSSKGGLVTGDEGARYIWKNTTDSSSSYRGWDAPTVLTSFESVRWTDASGVLKYTTEPDAVTLANQVVLVAYASRDTSRSSGEYGVEVSIRATAGTWSNVTVFSTSFATPANQLRSPCLVVLPSGRVLCLFWIFDNAGGANIRQYYSDDSGANWTLGASHCLRADVQYGTTGATYRVKRLRCSYSDGQLLLIAQATANHSGHDFNDVLIQWASIDNGHQFDLVTEQWRTDNDEAVGAFDLTVAGGHFILATISEDPAASYSRDLIVRRIGSAYQNIKNAAPVVADSGTWGAVTGGDTFTAAELAMVHDETGRLYIYGLSSGTGGGFIVSSYDNGVSWSSMGQGSAYSRSVWWYTNDTSTYPTSLAATSQGGRIMMLSNHVGAPGNEGNSVCALCLGGYSQVVMPGYTRYKSEDNRTTWERTWLPYDLPSDVGWTATGAGAATLESGAMTIATSATAKHFKIAPTGTAEEGIILYTSFEVDVDGLVTSDRAGIRVQCESAGVGHIVDIQCHTASFKVFDDVSASLLATVTVDMTAGVDIIIGVGDAKCSLWWRSRSTSGDRTWTKAINSAALGDNSGATGTHLIEFGNRQVGTATTKWHAVCYTSDEWAGTGLATAPTNPDDLMGRLYSATGTYVDDGVVIKSTDGPTSRGDEWTVATRYDYELDRCLTASKLLSPRIGWRSTSTGAQVISMQVSSVGEVTAASGVIAVGLYGTNVPEYTLHGYDDDASAWVSIATVESYDRLEGLRWTRKGSTVVVDTGGASTNEPLLSADEFSGGYFWLANGEGRKIAKHTGGKWSDGDTKHPVLELESVVGGDTASGTDGRIIPPDWVALFHTGNSTFSAYKISIPAVSGSVPSPPEAYWKIGTLFVGEVIIHGDETSWGRAITTTANTDLSTSRDGTRRSRNIGPERRVVEYSWEDGVDSSDADNITGTGDPDFGTASDIGTAPNALVHNDTAREVEGIVRRLSGPDAPVIYLPAIERITGGVTTQVLERRHWHMLGRVTSGIPVESIQGTERQDEVFRVGPVVIEEEV